MTRPFFPGYLFSRLDPSRAEIRLASYTPGVLYVVGYGGEPWPVPDEVIQLLHHRLEPGRGWAAGEAFHPGDRLRISGGRLDGVEGIFDRSLSASGRVQVLIRILRRSYRAEIHISQLRRINQAAGAASSSV